MGMLRGKFESDREIVPREVIVGKPSFRMCKCGCKRWYDVKTGEEVKVEIKSFGELLNKTKCHFGEEL